MMKQETEARNFQNSVPLPPIQQLFPYHSRGTRESLPPLRSIFPQIRTPPRIEEIIQKSLPEAELKEKETYYAEKLLSLKMRQKNSIPASKSTSFKKSRCPKKWSENEDTKLFELVKQGNTWANIADQIEGRSTNSCFQRWERVMNPQIDRTSWKLEEEEAILNAIEYQSNGNGNENSAEKRISWSAVSTLVETRTDIQCRYHYSVIQNSRKIPFGEEEGSLLQTLVGDVPLDQVNWEDISQTLRKTHSINRPCIECKKRYLFLKEKKS